MFGDPEERMRVLDDLAWNWKGVVEKTLRMNFDRRLFFRHPEQKDLYRLLSLRTWTLKYKLNIEEVLSVVLKFWDSMSDKYRRKARGGPQQGLGCTIPCLCGDRSEEVIEAHVRKRYPNGENIRAWKTSQRESYIRKRQIKVAFAEINAADGSLDSAVQDYTKSVLAIRSRRQALAEKLQSPKRRYPGSPWL